MIKVSYNQLIDILTVSQDSKIRVRYTSDVKMNKKGNPFFINSELQHEVKKTTECVYGFGQNYVELVREAAKQSGVQDSSFGTSGKSWAKALVADKVYINETTNALYLRVTVINDEHPSYVGYTVDGNPAGEEDLETIKTFERKTAGSVKKQSEYGVDDEKQVVPIMLSFDKIDFVEIDGQQFTLK